MILLSLCSRSLGVFTDRISGAFTDEISSVLPTIGWKKISIEGNRSTLQPGTKSDLGGIAKGFLSGKLMEIFRDHGVETGIALLGKRTDLGEKNRMEASEGVALQDPDDPDCYVWGS